MKTEKILWSLASAAIFIMSACSNDEWSENPPNTNNKSKSITLTSTIICTRTINTELQSGGQIGSGVRIGVFLTDASGTSRTTASRSADYNATYANRLFLADGNGNLTQTDYQPSLAFPYNDEAETTSQINVYAYAPYNATWTDVNENQTFSIGTDQSTDDAYIASDLLYGVPESNPITEKSDANNGSQPVSLGFKHLMAKINLEFTNEDETIDLAGATATIHGTDCSATVNLTTGTVTPLDHTMQSITVATEATTGNEEPVRAFSCSALIIPQTVDKGTAFVKLTTTDGQTYQYFIEDENGKEFNSGCSYSYQIKIATD